MLSPSSKDEPWRAICCFSCSTCALRSSSYCCCSMREREERRESERDERKEKRDSKWRERERERSERINAREREERANVLIVVLIINIIVDIIIINSRTSSCRSSGFTSIREGRRLSMYENFFPVRSAQKKSEEKSLERGKSEKTRVVTAISERVMNLK